MRLIDKIQLHCSATRENQDVSIYTIYNWHTWPKDVYNKDKEYMYTKYLGSRYSSRDKLPASVRDKHGRGFNNIAYNWYVAKDGTAFEGRPMSVMPASVSGYNRGAVAICYEGGLDSEGKPKDTRTDAQKATTEKLIREIVDVHPIIEIKGHRDYSPDKNNNGKIDKWEFIKSCPCFDTKEWLNEIKLVI